MDKQARVWAAARVRMPDTPAWCRAGSDHPSAKLFPIDSGPSAASRLYDPKTKETTTIDTCFTWGHVISTTTMCCGLRSGLPASRGGSTRGSGTKRMTKRKRRAGARSFSITTETGSATRTLNPISRPILPRTGGSTCLTTAIRRRRTARYWGSVLGMPGALVRFVPGSHPPETALAEYYEVPWNNPRRPSRAFRRAAWTWTARASSGRCFQRTLRQLRPQQVQGPSQWPGRRDRTALPGRLDALYLPRSELQGSRGERQRRLGVL